MKKNSKSSLTGRAVAAMGKAVAMVVEDHRQRSKPLALWRHGKAVWVPVGTEAVLNETAPVYRTTSRGATAKSRRK